MLDLKRHYYKGHDPCRSVLFVEQTRIAAEVLYRIDGAWVTSCLAAPTGRLDLPDIGTIGPLADAYRYTPLWPGEMIS